MEKNVILEVIGMYNSCLYICIYHTPPTLFPSFVLLSLRLLSLVPLSPLPHLLPLLIPHFLPLSSLLPSFLHLLFLVPYSPLPYPLLPPSSFAFSPCFSLHLLSLIPSPSSSFPCLSPSSLHLLSLISLVVRLDGSQPIRYGLKQEMEGKYANLHVHLTDKTGIHRFMLVDVFGGTIRVSVSLSDCSFTHICMYVSM